MVSLAFAGVALVYALVCTMAGFAPIGDLSSYRPEHGPVRKRFDGPVGEVVEAYRRAISGTAGMRLRDERGTTLLIDLRPTSRILGGDYGQAIRVVVEPDGAGSVVTCDASHKVRFGLGRHEAALAHAERELRMQAKRFGIRERLAGLETSSSNPGPSASSVAAVGPAPAGGWYPDPADPSCLRWWDGVAWTHHTTPRSAG